MSEVNKTSSPQQLEILTLHRSHTAGTGVGWSGAGRAWPPAPLCPRCPAQGSYHWTCRKAQTEAPMYLRSSHWGGIGVSCELWWLLVPHLSIADLLFVWLGKKIYHSQFYKLTRIRFIKGVYYTGYCGMTGIWIDEKLSWIYNKNKTMSWNESRKVLREKK